MPNIHPFPPRTYLVRFVDPGDGPWLAETKVGDTVEAVVAYLGGGHLNDRTLDSVYALDLTPGRLRISDVTGAVLPLVAGWVEAAQVDLPASVTDAFARYNVRAPISWSETDYREPYEDERQCYAIHGTNRWSA